MALINGVQPSNADPLGAGPAPASTAQSQTWDAMESYFECITTCSLDDGECVTHCVEQLREQG